MEVVREAHGFVRLSVSDGDERTEVDLAADARLFAPEQGPLVRTLAAEELAVDKVLAIFGRAEERDFIDLQALEVILVGRWSTHDGDAPGSLAGRFGCEAAFRSSAEDDYSREDEESAKKL